MGFKDFCKTQNENIKQDIIDDKKIEELYNSYKDMGQGQLISELFKNIDKQKKDGTFNYDGLCQSLDKISPFLTKEQNLKLKQLLQEVK